MQDGIRTLARLAAAVAALVTLAAGAYDHGVDRVAELEAQVQELEDDLWWHQDYIGDLEAELNQRPRLVVDIIGETIELDGHLDQVSNLVSCWEDEAVVVVVASFDGRPPFASDHGVVECAPYDDLTAGNRP